MASNLLRYENAIPNGDFLLIGCCLFPRWLYLLEHVLLDGNTNYLGHGTIGGERSFIVVKNAANNST